MKEFQCPLCCKWIPVDECDDHLLFQHRNEHIDVPSNYEEAKRRFSAVGMWEERELLQK